ncbi:hypothetical protein GDO78_022964, partial [Eleutherodactylus coqui]
SLECALCDLEEELCRHVWTRQGPEYPVISYSTQNRSPQFRILWCPSLHKRIYLINLSRMEKNRDKMVGK